MNRKDVPMLECSPIQAPYHIEGAFREQTAILQLVYVDEERQRAKFLRSFIAVGQPGMTGFDPDSPGEGTPAGWKMLWDMIKDRNVQVRGTFHTHPAGIHDFSGHDWTTQKALAQAFGRRFLWHMVQSIDSPGNSKVICMHMRHPVVFRYDFGYIDDDIHDPIVELPLPLNVPFECGVVDISVNS